jgi:hypothetical protein
MTGSAAGRLNGVLDADFLRLIRRPSAGSGACLGADGAAPQGPALSMLLAEPPGS